MRLFGYKIEIPEVENEFVRAVLISAATTGGQVVVTVVATYVKIRLDLDDDGL